MGLFVPLGWLLILREVSDGHYRSRHRQSNTVFRGAAIFLTNVATEVLTAVSTEITVFLNVTPCSLVVTNVSNVSALPP
jgi:hypothetical protein